MTAGGALTLFAGVTALVVAAVLFTATWRVRRQQEQPLDAPADLVRELTEEVRRQRAEAEHWRRTAERLQRELDGR